MYRKQEEFIEIETPYIQEVYRSKTLGGFMGRLDAKLCDMEYAIEAQKEEIMRLNGEISLESHKRMEEGNAMIGNILKACISVPDMNQMGPAAAIVIDKISDMTTIEEVQEYIQWLKAEGREQLKSKK